MTSQMKNMISDTDIEFLDSMEKLGVLKRLNTISFPLYLVGHLMYNVENAANVDRILRILRPSVVAISVDPKRFPTTYEYIVDDDTIYRNGMQKLRVKSVNYLNQGKQSFLKPFLFDGWRGYVKAVEIFLDRHIPYQHDPSALTPLYFTHGSILESVKSIGAQLVTLDRDISTTMDRLNYRSSTISSYINLYCMRTSFMISLLITAGVKYSRPNFENRLDRLYIPGMDPPYASSPIPTRVTRVESIPLHPSNTTHASYRYLCQMIRNQKSWREEMIFNSRWCYQVLIRECGAVVADKLKILDTADNDGNGSYQNDSKFIEGGMVCVADYSIFESITKRFEDGNLNNSDRYNNLKILNQRKVLDRGKGIETIGGCFSNDKIFGDFVDGFNFGFLSFTGIVLIATPFLSVYLLGRAAAARNRRFLFEPSTKSL